MSSNKIKFGDCFREEGSGRRVLIVDVDADYRWIVGLYDNGHTFQDAPQLCGRWSKPTKKHLEMAAVWLRDEYKRVSSSDDFERLDKQLVQLDALLERQ